MAFLFMDGFSHYQTSDLARKKWTSKSDTDVTWSIVTEGRVGSCVKRVSSVGFANSGYLVKSPIVNQTGVWTPQVSGVCGFAIKIDDLNSINPLPSVPVIQELKDTVFSVWNGAWGMFGVVVNTDGTLSLYQGQFNPSPPLLATSIGAMSSGSWCFLEFKWTISQTTGSCIIRANGVQVMNYSGVLFPNVLGATPPTVAWTSVYCFGVRSTIAPLVLRACDFYLLDQTGSSNNDFLGDITVSYTRPDSAGATSGWTPSTGLNWQNVDEVPPNDDTDYNTATAISTLDLYGFEPCAVTNPLAVQQCILSRRTAPGSATIQSVTRPVSTNFSSTAQAVSDETYSYNCFPYDTNPDTTAAWTQAQVDAAQFGINKAT